MRPHERRPVTRNWLVTLVALLALFALVAAACGDDDDAATDPGAAQDSDVGESTEPAAPDDEEPAPTADDDAAAPDDEEPASTADDDAAPNQATDAGGGTFVFGTPADISTMDPGLANDNASYRVIAQIFDTLVDLAPGSGSEIVPGLATHWSQSADGTEWTFTLREGVTFHDGTAFDAGAAAANFDRWANLPEELQGFAFLYGFIHGGFGTDSNIASATAVDASTLVIKLREARPTFLSALTLPVFSIASPAALAAYDADNPDPTQNTFGVSNPVGTGPFKFVEWVQGDHVTLERYDGYWGDPAASAELTLRPIGDSAARLNALRAGDIHGYDGVNPLDIDAINDAAGVSVVPRPSCNVGYLGLNQTQAPLDNLRIRQAIAHSINKAAIVDRFYRDTGQPATLFLAPGLPFYDNSISDYAYDPGRAAELIAQSGIQDPVLEFTYPSDVTRPYMPDPRGIFEAIAADLEAAGFTVEADVLTWTEYLPKAQGGELPLHLLGWICDYPYPDNFYQGLFGGTADGPAPQFGWDDSAFQSLLTRAVAEFDDDAAAGLWSQVQQAVVDAVPAVPIANAAPALALADGVSGFVASPVLIEDFREVTAP